MNKPFAIKLGIIFFIAILLNIPLSMISSKTHERSEFRHEAYNAIAKSWTRSQKIIGPIIQVPFTVEATKSVWDKNLNSYKDTTSKIKKSMWFVVDELSIVSHVDNDVRYKGIYEVPVYTTKLSFEGSLLDGVIENIEQRPDLVEIHSPILSLSVSDPRGINSIPKLKIGSNEQSFMPGSLLPFNSSGIHTKLDKKILTDEVSFSFDIEIRGMDKLSFVPVSKDAQVSMASQWPHPSFLGDFLPSERTIDDSGYQAEWKITSFASNIEEKVRSCAQDNCQSLTNSDFGVRHIDPVDVYLQSERSVKYGFLFIALSFITFFLFEILKSMSIHSVQYALVGFAVAIFYLLLLALSEHLSFALAYLMATISCIGLLHIYLTSILQSFKHAAIFSLVFSILYGVLYLIIKSEDFALLMGSILTFTALSAMMISTKNIDWFEVGEKLKKIKIKNEQKPIETE
ncbi:MAG: cell envelope integrity protein CreD [Cellvibrionaceae bacterium]